jgi:hypothetical protein
MNSTVSLAIRLLKLIGGLALIVTGAAPFVILTSAINEPPSMGGPMNFGTFGIFAYWPVALILDVVFVSLVYGGVKLAGFGSRTFGIIILVAGIGILSLGIRNHVTGPPLDYDSSLPETNKAHVPFELNLIVYFWAGVAIVGGLLLTVFAARGRES